MKEVKQGRVLSDFVVTHKPFEMEHGKVTWGYWLSERLVKLYKANTGRAKVKLEPYLLKYFTLYLFTSAINIVLVLTRIMTKLVY